LRYFVAVPARQSVRRAIYRAFVDINFYIQIAYIYMQNAYGSPNDKIGINTTYKLYFYGFS